VSSFCRILGLLTVLFSLAGCGVTTAETTELTEEEQAAAVREMAAIEDSELAEQQRVMNEAAQTAKASKK
jgi:hypothetical protein